jgi:nicotinic acid mononucleotide adenylyltransferase
MGTDMAKDEAKWAYWEKHIKAWRASGLSRNAYCQREGLKPTTFDYWRPLIGSDQADVKTVKPAVSGNDITLVSVEVDPPRADNPSKLITLKSPTGWEMQLPAEVNTRWLIDVLRQLP